VLLADPCIHAAIGVSFITARASVVNAAQIQRGETILIVAAAGATLQKYREISAEGLAGEWIDTPQIHKEASNFSETPKS
jgi:hypothetical protein